MNAVKIKCRDLMVGDWITNRNGFPMQVTNVGAGYAYTTAAGYEGDVWVVNDKGNKPQPIEITDELLQDNGWEVKSHNFPYGIKDYFAVKDEGTNHLEWKSGTLNIWLDYEKDNDGVYSDILVPCKYVHQLQQVLRLAGMTELANNFKMQ